MIQCYENKFSVELFQTSFCNVLIFSLIIFLGDLFFESEWIKRKIDFRQGISFKGI